MGFEVFLVELRGGTATYKEANEAVRKLSHVKPDADGGFMPGATYYVFRDGIHTIEMELMDVPVRLSCRFTFCHPPSVDAVFLSLVRQLMSQLGMEVTIRDDVRPEHGTLSRSISLKSSRRLSWAILPLDEPNGSRPLATNRWACPRMRSFGGSSCHAVTRGSNSRHEPTGLDGRQEQSLLVKVAARCPRQPDRSGSSLRSIPVSCGFRRGGFREQTQGNSPARSPSTVRASTECCRRWSCGEKNGELQLIDGVTRSTARGETSSGPADYC